MYGTKHLEAGLRHSLLPMDKQRSYFTYQRDIDPLNIFFTK